MLVRKQALRARCCSTWSKKRLSDVAFQQPPVVLGEYRDVPGGIVHASDFARRASRLNGFRTCGAQKSHVWLGSMIAPWKGGLGGNFSASPRVLDNGRAATVYCPAK